MTERELIMNRNEILKKLEEIFKKVFEDDSIVLTENMMPSDLDKWDSLHQVMLISQIQNVFQITYRPKGIKELKNVGLIADSIMEKL